MKARLFVHALLALLFSFAWPRVAQAGPMGIHPLEGSRLAAVAAAPPSPQQAWGTVLVSWCEQEPKDSTVYLGEWDLQAGRWLSTAIVRHDPLCPATLHLAWSRQRLVLVTGVDAQATTELIVLERRERAFVEVDKIQFDGAEAPSLDVDDSYIALATYERVTPIDEVTADMRDFPAYLALHVRILDPATLRIVGARMFRGDHLLRRHSVAELAGHAIRFLAGRLYVAVADRDPRIVAARVPSLATEVERTFPVPRGLRDINSSSIVLNRLGDNLLIGIEATYVLSPKLETVAKHDRMSMRQPIAFDPATHRALAIDGEPVTLNGWTVRVVAEADPSTVHLLTVLFAHGRGVVLDAARGAIRVLR